MHRSSNDARPLQKQPLGLRGALMRWLLAVASLTLSCSASREAFAQSHVEALLHEGVSLRRQGRDEEALEVFRRAHAEAPNPRTSAQMALAAQAVGNWVEAEAGLLEALQRPADPWIARNRDVLRTALERVQGELGTLTIDTDLPGASVRVNGVPVGTAPLGAALRVKAGATSVEVERGNQPVLTRQVVVPARGEVIAALKARETEREARTPPTAAPLDAAARVQPDAAPNDAAFPASRRVSSPAPSPPPSAALSLPLDSPPANDPSSPPRWLGWTLLGASGGLLATGVVAHVIRNDSADRYNDDSRCFYGDLTRDQRCSRTRQTFDRAQSVAITGYILGGAALGAALTLLLWPEPARESERRGHVACIDAQISDRTAYVSAAVKF